MFCATSALALYMRFKKKLAAFMSYFYERNFIFISFFTFQLKFKRKKFVVNFWTDLGQLSQRFDHEIIANAEYDITKSSFLHFTVVTPQHLQIRHTNILIFFCEHFDICR